MAFVRKKRKKQKGKNTFSHSRYNWHDKRSTRSSPWRVFPDTGGTRCVVKRQSFERLLRLFTYDSSTKVNYGGIVRALRPPIVSNERTFDNFTRSTLGSNRIVREKCALDRWKGLKRE